MRLRAKQQHSRSDEGTNQPAHNRALLRSDQWRPQTIPQTEQEPLPIMTTSRKLGHTSIWVDGSASGGPARCEAANATAGWGVVVANTETFYGPVITGSHELSAGAIQHTNYAAETQAVYEGLSYYKHAMEQRLAEPDATGKYNLTITGDSSAVQKVVGGRAKTSGEYNLVRATQQVLQELEDNNVTIEWKWQAAHIVVF